MYVLHRPSHSARSACMGSDSSAMRHGPPPPLDMQVETFLASAKEFSSGPERSVGTCGFFHEADGFCVFRKSKAEGRHVEA